MLEADRLAYLKAMGITNYMPRWHLPGAPEPQVTPFLPTAESLPRDQAASTADDLQQPAHIPALSPAQLSSPAQDGHTSFTDQARSKPVKFATLTQDLAPENSTSVPVTHRSGPPLEQTTQPETSHVSGERLEVPTQAQAPQPQPISQSKPKKEAVLPAHAQNSAQVVKFTLSFWRVSEDLLVVDSRHSELALPTEKLLTNLLFALGYPRELPKSEVVQWPLIDAHHHDQGETAARETLNAFLDAQFLLNPGKYLLLMGREASHFILDTGKSYSDMLNHRFPVDEFNLTAFVIPSLSEILQDPAQKSPTWHTIKTLRR